MQKGNNVISVKDSPKIQEMHPIEVSVSHMNWSQINSRPKTGKVQVKRRNVSQRQVHSVIPSPRGSLRNSFIEQSGNPLVKIKQSVFESIPIQIEEDKYRPFAERKMSGSYASNQTLIEEAKKELKPKTLKMSYMKKRIQEMKLETAQASKFVMQRTSQKEMEHKKVTPHTFNSSFFNQTVEVKQQGERHNCSLTGVNFLKGDAKKVATP